MAEFTQKKIEFDIFLMKHIPLLFLLDLLRSHFTILIILILHDSYYLNKTEQSPSD